MKKSILDRLTALESRTQTAQGEKQSQLISACFDALEKFFPNIAVDAKPLAQVIQRLKDGELTPEDQALLDTMPNAELEAIGATALRFLEALLHLEENY